MNFIWVKKNKGASSILVFFSGWGFAPPVISHLQGDHDLLFISDYRDLTHNLPDLSHYETRILVTWSFGIVSYAHWQTQNQDPFTYKVAINGSMNPISNETGIAPRMMQKTINNLSKSSFQNFVTNCYGAPQEFHEIDVEARKQELQAIQNRGAATMLNWNKIWISKRDRIFSYQNTLRAWQDHTENIHVINAPHFPFRHWSYWDEVVR